MLFRPLVFGALIMVLAPSPARAFTLSSPDIAPNSVIDKRHVFDACGGQNISPALKWENPPEGTKSFAVTVYDPDAPTGSGWWHWIFYDLHAFSDGIPEGMGSGAMGIPKHAKQARNDYGTMNYGGPCPPVGHGPHRYVFTVYALKVEKLDVPKDASAAMIGFNLNAQMIEKAEFTATYGR